MATIAVFIALGGVTWAAATIDSKDVVDNSLKSTDLKDEKAVKGDDVAPDALGGADVDESSLAQVPSAANSDMLDGKDSTAFYAQVVLRSASNATTSSSAQVSCQGGETLVGGGGQSQVAPVQGSVPSGQQWSVVVQNAQAAGTLTAYALCAAP